MTTQYELTLSQAGVTDWKPVDTTDGRSTQFSISLTITGTATATIEISASSSRALPISHPELTDRAVSSFGVWDAPTEAFRLNVSSYTSGTVTAEILQGPRT